MTERERQLVEALRLTTTAVAAFLNLMESISDGKSYPALMTIRRYHDMASEALAAAQLVGVDPTLTEEPDV